MAAAFVDPFLSSELMEAEVTVTGQQRHMETVPTWVSRIWRSGMLVSAEPSLPVGTLAWLKVVLPSGTRVRPLVEVVNRDEGTIGVRYRHVFPDDQRALEAFHATCC